MHNCPTELEMTRYIEQKATGSERHSIDAHLHECPDCRRLYACLVELQQASDAQQLPSVTKKEINAAIRRLSEDGLFHKMPENRLADFFHGLISVTQATQLVLDSPLLAQHTRASFKWEGQRQVVENLCALRCEALILERAGIPFANADLLEEAVKEGWFMPGKGTPLLHLGRLLIRHGLEVERYQHADIDVLRYALKSGYQCIVAVDAGELQTNRRLGRWLERIEDLIAYIPDHCLVISGVGREEEKDVVIVLDPNTPGKSKAIPQAAFLEAWKDSDFFLLAAQLPKTVGDKGQEKRP